MGDEPNDPDRLIRSRYEKKELLGSGGMAEVWRGWDRDLRRWVALKFLKHADEEERARFVREARTAANLNHPNIAAVYEVGEADARPFIAMQLVEGRTLRDHARDDLPALVRLVRDAALAVEYANRKGVVHRDLKPENLMVDSTGRVYVMDFGLARMTAVDSSISMSGLIVGTAAYMPPEQARGRLREVDARSDVYALGATLYELLTDRPPFDGDIYTILQKVIDVDPAPPRALRPGIDRDLETIVLKSLEKSPERRYASARELADDLTRYLDGDPIRAHPPSALYRMGKFLARRKAVALPTAAALLLAFGFGAWAFAGAIQKSGRIRSGLADGAKMEEAENWKAARDAYRSVLDLDPGNDSARAGFARTDAKVEEVERRLAEAEKRKELAAAIKPLEETMRNSRLMFYIPDVDIVAELDKVRAAARGLETLMARPDFARLADGWKALGMGEHFLGDAARAEEALRRAEELAPDDPGTAFYLGAIHLERAVAALLTGGGTPREEKQRQSREFARIAEEYFRREGALWEGAREIDRDLARVHLLLAAGKEKEVEQACLEGLKRFEKELGAEGYWCLLGWVRKVTESVAAFHEALKRRPHYAWGFFFRGSARHQSGDPDGAAADYTRAVELNPRFAEAYSQRGLIRQDRGDLDGALADYDRAIEIRPGFTIALLNRGVVRSDRGDHDGALEDYEATLRLDPRNADAYNNRGIIRKSRGDYDGALEDYDRAIESNRDLGEAYVNRAEIRGRRGEYAAALADYDRGIALGQRPMNVLFNRGNALLNLGRVEDALRDYEEAIRIGPANAEAHTMCGVARVDLGRLDEAIRDFDRAISIDPRFARAYVNRGMVFNRNGDHARAMADYDKSIALDPGIGETYLNRGVLHERLGRLDEAIRDHTTAAGLLPNSPVPYYNRATAKWRKGDLEGAASDFERALEVAPADWPHRSRVEEFLRKLRPK